MTDQDYKTLAERLDRIEQATLIASKHVLTIDEAAAYTGYSRSGMYKLAAANEVSYYKQTGRLYFKKSELEQWMTTHKVMSNDEINARAEAVLAANKAARAKRKASKTAKTAQP